MMEAQQNRTASLIKSLEYNASLNLIHLKLETSFCHVSNIQLKSTSNLRIASKRYSALLLKNVKIYFVYYTLSTSLLSMQRKRMRCDKVGTISLNTKLNQDQNFNVFKNIKNLFLLDF